MFKKYYLVRWIKKGEKYGYYCQKGLSEDSANFLAEQLAKNHDYYDIRIERDFTA